MPSKHFATYYIIVDHKSKKEDKIALDRRQAYLW